MCTTSLCAGVCVSVRGLRQRPTQSGTSVIAGEEDLDLRQCPVTFEDYGLDGPSRPRVLPCGHSLSEAAVAQVRTPHS
jgi:hypothetical protein